MKVLTVASNFPDKYHQTMAPWSKRQVDSIRTYSDIDLEVVVPRPFSISLKIFPYHEYARLPSKEISDLGYAIHYPRFPYLLPKKLFYPLSGDLYQFFISHYILKNIKRPDIVHARFAYLDGYGLLKACEKWKIKLIFDAHGDIGEYWTLPFTRNKIRKAIRYVEKILCVAKYQVKIGVEIGIPEEKLEVIPLGININKFKPRNKEKIRKEFGIQEQKIVLFVGQLIERKGIKYLLRAISQIDSSHRKDSKVVIIGSGSEKKDLLNLSRKLGIENIVAFTGKVPENDLLKWYSLADLFVLPSLSEGRPTVINEAMASECAIVATNIHGIPEQVNDGYNGFLVYPENPDMLAEKIGFLLNNEDEMTRMGKNSRRRIIENSWTWEGYAERITNIYKKLINGGE